MGLKLNKAMYLDLFGKEPPKIESYIHTISPSGISINDIYSDREFQYHHVFGSAAFSLFGIKADDINKGNQMKIYLSSLSGKNTASSSMNNIATFLNGKAGTDVDRLVALFFDIAIVIYSLYYKEGDKNDPEKIKVSLRNIYNSTLKSFMIPSVRGIAGNTEEAIIQKFIAYYMAGSGISDNGGKQTARLKSLRSKTGGTRKSRKSHKYKKTRKHIIRKSSKTQKRHSKKSKNTRRK